MKYRLDHALVQRGLAPTRSQAESWIRMGRVMVAGVVRQKPGFFVGDMDDIRLDAPEQYVSRAGLKLASVAKRFRLDFADSIVLDVGSSTGGFTDYALQHGARFVYAVDVGTNQLHPSLHNNARIELHEKTDIRVFYPSETPTIVVIDVSFISLRDVLPHIARIAGRDTAIIAMVKPQFEATRGQLTGAGVVKNDTIRRRILTDFEQWAKHRFVVKDKADSEVKGKNGNHERFYFLQTAI